MGQGFIIDRDPSWGFSADLSVSFHIPVAVTQKVHREH